MPFRYRLPVVHNGQVWLATAEPPGVEVGALPDPSPVHWVLRSISGFSERELRGPQFQVGQDFEQVKEECRRILATWQ